MSAYYEKVFKSAEVEFQDLMPQEAQEQRMCHCEYDSLENKQARLK
ncbi:MAG: hypothetical protein IPN22_09625 [Bacteroidetes bacterium]|nr:hypothetical protein [Bacteroidota bacterium]